MGKTVPFNKKGIKRFIKDAVSIATSFIEVAKYGMIASSQLEGENAVTVTFYDAQAVNAIGCMVENVGNNAWRFVMAAYWLAVEFGYEKELKE